jgi:sentrin-specific protease 1
MDEISMTSMENMFQIDERMRQIFKTNEDFGGKSILVVGDFNQMEPVMAKWIFDEPTIGQNILAENHLWPKFKFFELTQCMRQMNDIPFAEALNRLAIGQCNQEDIVMFQTREIQRNKLIPPDSAIRLKYTNEDVGRYNEQALALLPTEGIVAHANDRAQGRGDLKDHPELLAKAKRKLLKDTQSLPLQILLKLGGRYMMTINCDTSDGLVNGGIGRLRKITYGTTRDGSKVPLKLWIEFQKDVGKKLKKSYKLFGKKKEDFHDWVACGMERRVIYSWPGKNLEVIRKQFPFVAAEAITIHKSQGSTFPEVAVSTQYVTKSGRRAIPRRALYVAFSRCTSLSGLYIDGTFVPPAPPSANDKVVLAMEKLRERPVIFDDDEDATGKHYEEDMIWEDEDVVYENENVEIESDFETLTLDDDIDNEMPEKDQNDELDDNVIILDINGALIARKDLNSTFGKEWLYDAVVDGYINLIAERSTRGITPSVYNFGTFFFLHIEGSPYRQVGFRKSWEHETNSSLMVFPRCARQHWVVYVADRLSGKVVLYDSLCRDRQHYNGPTNDFQVIVEFLNFCDAMYRPANSTPWTTEIFELNSQQWQHNTYDCGPFICTFVEYLSRGQIFDFSEKDMVNKRVQIRESILNLSIT